MISDFTNVKFKILTRSNNGLVINIAVKRIFLDLKHRTFPEKQKA